jgi:hypothetical protein
MSLLQEEGRVLVSIEGDLTRVQIAAFAGLNYNRRAAPQSIEGVTT